MNGAKIQGLESFVNHVWIFFACERRVEVRDPFRHSVGTSHDPTLRDAHQCYLPQ